MGTPDIAAKNKKLEISETNVTNKILKALNALPRTYARKVHGGRYGAGWPDIVGCSGGTMFAIEVKKPGGSYGVTKLQRAELDKWARTGAATGVATSVEEALFILDQHGCNIR